MKKIFFILIINLLVFTGCTSDDDFAIPDFAKTFVNIRGNNFSNYGTASSEVAFNDKGWQNFNTQGTRVWNIRRNFINNVDQQRYVEFNSFDSNASQSPNDEVWMITPPLDFSKSKNEAITLDARSRFFNGNVLEVLYSTNYDGNPDNVNSATWNPVALNIPTNSSSAIEPFTRTNVASIASDSIVRVAFKYTGSKLSAPTSTIQLSRIIIFENREQ